MITKCDIPMNRFFLSTIFLVFSLCAFSSELTFNPQFQISNNKEPDSETGTFTAINNSGQAVVTWISKKNVYAATRDILGKWSAPTRVNAISEGSNDNVLNIHWAVINDSGEIIILWSTNNSPEWLTTDVPEQDRGNVYIASRDYRGNWSNEKQLNSPSGPTADSSLPMQVSMNESGEALVSWATVTEGSKNIYVASRNSNGVWSSEEQINALTGGSANMAMTPFISINDSGQAVASWNTQISEEYDRGNVYVASRDSNGNWSEEQQINSLSGPTANISTTPNVVINNSGEAVLTWYTAIPCSEPEDDPTGNVYVASRDSGGNWSSEKQVNSPSEESADLSLFAYANLNASGHATITWCSMKAPFMGGEVYSASRNTKGLWSNEYLIYSNSNQFNFIALSSLNESGEALACITSHQTENELGKITALSRDSSGAWSSQQQVNSKESELIAPVIVTALNNSGEALLTWISKKGKKRYVFAVETTSTRKG